MKNDKLKHNMRNSESLNTMRSLEQHIKELKTESNFKEYLSKTDKKVDKFNLEPISREETWCHIKSVPPKTSSGFDNIPWPHYSL